MFRCGAAHAKVFKLPPKCVCVQRLAQNKARVYTYGLWTFAGTGGLGGSGRFWPSMPWTLNTRGSSTTWDWWQGNSARWAAFHVGGLTLTHGGWKTTMKEYINKENWTFPLQSFSSWSPASAGTSATVVSRFDAAIKMIFFWWFFFFSAHWPVLPVCWAQHKGQWAYTAIYLKKCLVSCTVDFSWHHLCWALR